MPRYNSISDLPEGMRKKSENSDRAAEKQFGTETENTGEGNLAEFQKNKTRGRECENG